jgi:hypothetical protein
LYGEAPKGVNEGGSPVRMFAEGSRCVRRPFGVRGASGR